METEVYIVSGFLGAGKTTLIQKIIKEAFLGRKIALIENDFGEAHIDANFLRNEQIEIAEINDGCICCSLSGDFVKALSQLIKVYAPEVIIIEPSGVSKLSDVEKACSKIDQVKIMSKITVVDTKRCERYYENFGAFYEDQIENADTVIFSHNDLATDSEKAMLEPEEAVSESKEAMPEAQNSRCMQDLRRMQDFQDQSESAMQLIRKLNKNAKIIASPWQHLNIETVLVSEKGTTLFQICNSHSDHCTCHLDHSVEDVFQTCTVTLDQAIKINALNGYFQRIEQYPKINLIRAKGVLETDQGYLNIQYVQGELKLTPSPYSGNKITFIGCDLDALMITELFKSGCP